MDYIEVKQDLLRNQIYEPKPDSAANFGDTFNPTKIKDSLPDQKERIALPEILRE